MITTPLRIETPEQFDTWQRGASASLYLVDQDGGHGPFLAWRNDDGQWFGTRAVSEDDGAWDALPAAVRKTYAIPTTLRVPNGYGDAESFSPFWVLWDDAAPYPDDLDHILQRVENERRSHPAKGWTREHDKAMGGAPHLVEQASKRMIEAAEIGTVEHDLAAVRPLLQAAALVAGAIQEIEAANTCAFCHKIREVFTRGAGGVNTCADCLTDGEVA